MQGVNWQSRNETLLACLSVACLWATGYFAPVVVEAQSAAVTVFEGARLIAGDASAPVGDAAFIVDNGRFTVVGRQGQLKVPAGAAHVDLTGKTVIPAIVDARSISR